jgi:hypothetical protein
MSSELPTAREVFENALFAICLQIQARSHAVEERYSEAVELGKSDRTDVLIMQYASLITKRPAAVGSPKAEKDHRRELKRAFDEN